ncbi:MAG: aldehyde dehydrogenase family protein, partial [Syntrophobacteraceae bacterium]|nr:aldehyde dehydrogenase family protein [Syntrophobacteraceae bacterium]
MIDPCSGEAFAEVAGADEHLVDLAIESGQTALPGWRSLPVHQRAKVLRAVAQSIRDGSERLAQLLSREVGKPLGAARDEVLSAASLFDFFAEEASRLSGRIPLLGVAREQVMILREPIGVVVAITPFNYPLSTLTAKVAPALAVGCTVVAKPDEHTPGSTLEVARLAVEAGLPAGVFNVLVGDGPSTGRYAVNHPIPRMVTFTEALHRICNSFGICQQNTVKWDCELLNLPEMAELHEAATGWETTAEDLRRIAARQ